MAPSKVVELASRIMENATKFEEHYRSQGLPAPSFDADEPLRVQLPDDVARVREAILEANAELQELIQGPVGIIQHATAFHSHLISLHAIYRFKIATCLPVNSETSYEQLSQACGLNVSDLRRIVRYCTTWHIFKEPRKGYVAHTGPSKALAEIPLLREWVGMVCEEMWPSATQTVDALVKWPGSQEPQHTGFTLSHNTPDSIFTDLSKHPARAERFAKAMSMFNSREGMEPFHLLDAYPWTSLNDGKGSLVVDVGGSHGPVSIALAQRFPSVRCIVQDLPDTIAKGPAQTPPELRDRVTFMAHDFFTPQPVVGADVYYFRWIFHDWSDKYSIQILKNLIPALKPDARVVISEYCLPEPGMISLLKERMMRAFDLAMLELQNSKEREADNWAALFEHADPRFEFMGVRAPPKSHLAIIEAKWKGDDT